DYTAKIEALDEQLNAYRIGNVENNKRAELKAMNYTDAQVERYLSHVEGETASEIKASVLELMDVIPPPVDKFGDPSAFNGAKAKPKAKDKTEIGRNAVSRIL